MANGEFKSARDLLLNLREDYDLARSAFAWPRPEYFNWALDWFDDELANGPLADQAALIVLGAAVERYTFKELSVSSNRFANGLRGLGAKRGDRMLLMLANVGPLWAATLAAMKLGLVIIPATPQLTEADIDDRIARGRAKFVLCDAADVGKFAAAGGETVRIALGAPPPGWLAYDDLAACSGYFAPDGPTPADDPLLLYFTSGTTARPKLALHSHASYPIGHLSTMYGLRLRPGDRHYNISSPGWAKHAWSNVFAPWNAGATAVALGRRFDARTALDEIVEYKIDSFCAPPTVWRHFIQFDLKQWKVNLREISSSGEPLNPEVIENVGRAWGLTLRDCMGQTETTMMLGNPAGQPIVVGAMGRPMPGFDVTLLDGEGREAEHGELALKLKPRPVGLMLGYQEDDGSIRRIAGEHYRTGDIAERDAQGYLTYVGRADDLFKSSDYRLSPFELESALIEHPAIVEAAVAAAPDPARFTVAKAYIILAEGFAPTRETAGDIFAFLDKRLAPYKRVRRLEFSDLPKTISGKIRRVQLRQREEELFKRGERPAGEFRLEDFHDS